MGCISSCQIVFESFDFAHYVCSCHYNNQQKAKGSHSSFVRNINNALLKNRKVLESILPREEETARAHKEKLQRLGFQFKYITHIYTTKSGKTYFYCYDYGYLPLDNDWYLIVRKKEDWVESFGAFIFYILYRMDWFNEAFCTILLSKLNLLFHTEILLYADIM